MNENQMFLEWKTYAEERAKNLVPDHLSEDATQEAYVGLLKAIRTFNPEQGYQFNTYATNCIRNAVYDFMRKENRQTENLVYTDKMDEILPSTEASAHSEMERYELNVAIREACGETTVREDYILAHRLLSDNPLTLETIAFHFSTTKYSIKRDEDRLKSRIKENFDYGDYWNNS